MSEPNTRIDPNLEALIDSAGREKVFARARELGWTADNPPPWVWQEIARSLMSPPAVWHPLGWIDDLAT